MSTTPALCGPSSRRQDTIQSIQVRAGYGPISQVSDVVATLAESAITHPLLHSSAMTLDRSGGSPSYG